MFWCFVPKDKFKNIWYLVGNVLYHFVRTKDVLKVVHEIENSKVGECYFFSGIKSIIYGGGGFMVILTC